jgi:hypothetical protein
MNFLGTRVERLEIARHIFWQGKELQSGCNKGGSDGRKSWSVVVGGIGSLFMVVRGNLP